SITFATVNGVAAASTSQPSPPHGSTVTFNTSAGSLAGWEWPMVVLSCYQDVNGDGTGGMNLLGPDLGYETRASPGATFGAAGGNGTAGDAKCHAYLYAYGWKNGQESIRYLDGTEDWTAAW